MEKHSFNYSSAFAVLTLDEVASAIKLKDRTSVAKWLKDNDITPHKIGKKNVVYALDVNCALAVPLARRMLRNDPENWKQNFERICAYEPLYNMVLTSLGNLNSSYSPTTKVVPKNKKENQLLKRLMS